MAAATLSLAGGCVSKRPSDLGSDGVTDTLADSAHEDGGVPKRSDAPLPSTGGVSDISSKPLDAGIAASGSARPITLTAPTAEGTWPQPVYDPETDSCSRCKSARVESEGLECEAWSVCGGRCITLGIVNCCDETECSGSCAPGGQCICGELDGGCEGNGSSYCLESPTLHARSCARVNSNPGTK